MPWCPKCKCEYREGITECADCKVPLVDELPAAEPIEEEDMFSYEAQGQTEEGDGQPVISAREHVGVYQDKNTKAEDFKSSAYTLLIVGILGMIALILIELGVLPIRLAAPGKYITYGVMGAMFAIFIIMGISSFRSSKKYESEAKAEDELTKAVKDWVMQNLSREAVERQAALQEDAQEMQYFHNYAVIKEAVTGQFGELESTYLDALCEEIYGMLFD